MDEVVIPIIIRVILTLMVALPGIAAMYLSAKSKAPKRELAFAISCAATAFSVIGTFYILSFDLLMGTAGLIACLGSITFSYWVVAKSNLLKEAPATETPSVP